MRHLAYINTISKKVAFIYLFQYVPKKAKKDFHFPIYIEGRRILYRRPYPDLKNSDSDATRAGEDTS
jgi:hypothetical protein